MTQEDYPTDFRALCAELNKWVIELAASHSNLSDSGIAKVNELVDRTVAALAQPEPQGPTDKELCKTLHQAICDFPPTHPSAHDLDGHQYEIALEIRKARAVLARWGK
jgi:hypothetical protein